MTSLTRPSGAGQDRFTPIPSTLDAIVHAPREYQLVCVLLSYRWTEHAAIFPSVKTLAERMHCSRRTVQRACASLERRGLLVREARYREDDGQQSNLYSLAGALLALVRVSVDAHHRADRRTPASTRPAERHSGNHKQRTRGPESRIPTHASAYFETRSGTLRRK